jgi:hypothetical protein
MEVFMKICLIAHPTIPDDVTQFLAKLGYSCVFLKNEDEVLNTRLICAHKNDVEPVILALAEMSERYDAILLPNMQAPARTLFARACKTPIFYPTLDKNYQFSGFLEVTTCSINSHEKV